MCKRTPRFGLALKRGDPGAMTVVLTLLARHTNPVVRGQRLRPRLIDGDGGELVAVFNDSRTESCKEDIVLPRKYGRAVYVSTGKDVPMNNRCCAIEVEPNGVCVIELTR